MYSFLVEVLGNRPMSLLRCLLRVVLPDLIATEVFYLMERKLFRLVTGLAQDLLRSSRLLGFLLDLTS